uniref:hypothetical protein n=1 Tax=Neisseria lactamica TaxID=486 RepID=UPI001E3A3CFB|nr:hypothetical protein [Neisseria lactamica]
MAKGRTSIKERLKKSRKREVRREMAHDWADKWEQDYLSLLSQIKRAIAKNDEDELAFYLPICAPCNSLNLRRCTA